MSVGTATIKTFLRLGIPMGSLALLSVRGRKSGKVYTTPVALVERGQERWLVAAFGEVNWVRNLRAAGQARLRRGRRSEAIGAVELDAHAAAPILQEFLRQYHRIPFMRPYFHLVPTAPLADFEREAAHHPIFRVAPPGAAV